MDTLPWIRLNSKVQFTNTRKLFFNNYLYRIKFNVPGGRIAKNHPPELVGHQIETRIKFDQIIRDIHPGSWRKKELDNIEVLQVEWWSRLFGENPNLFYRVEEPYISVYSNDINELYLMFSEEPFLPNSLLSVSAPESKETEQLLLEGKIIVKRIPGYTHVVYFRECWDDNNAEAKLAILNYLQSLGDQIRMPRSTVNALKTRWGTRGYFYCSDPTIATFISLIYPGIIGKIFPLEHLSE